MAQDASQLIQLHQICTTIINGFKIIATYLKPVVPQLVQKIEHYLAIPELDFNNYNTILLNHQINQYEHLIKRIEPGLL
jgi:methionyl-tRNA synthetase